MKKYILLILSTLVFIGVKSQMLPEPLPSPLQTGAYVPGIISPRDYANPGFSGLAVMDYNIYFNAGNFIDKYGNPVNSIDLVPDPAGISIPVETDVSGYINAPVIAYVSPEIKALGNARYIGVIAPYYATATFSATLRELPNGDKYFSGGAGGMGDLMISPVLLTWSDANDKTDLTAGYIFTAPTGRYETGADDNIGLGYWSHIFQVYNYIYLMPEKASAFFIGNTFETHSKIKDADVKPGNRYTLEYGISQYLSERMEITAQGGHTWQVSKDAGNDVYWDASYKDRYSTVGLGVGFWPVKQTLYLNAKWTTNYAIRQHFKYNSFQLQLIWAIGFPEQ
jgi:hypothetical protein